VPYPWVAKESPTSQAKDGPSRKEGQSGLQTGNVPPSLKQARAQ